MGNLGMKDGASSEGTKTIILYILKIDFHIKFYTSILKQLKFYAIFNYNICTASRGSILLTSAWNYYQYLMEWGQIKEEEREREREKKKTAKKEKEDSIVDIENGKYWKYFMKSE